MKHGLLESIIAKYRELFEGGMSQGLSVSDIVRHWINEYKADGIPADIQRSMEKCIGKDCDVDSDDIPGYLKMLISENLKTGIEVEFGEHIDEPGKSDDNDPDKKEQARKIAMDHLMERPDYYMALELAGIE